jgi:hypothetical protein
MMFNFRTLGDIIRTVTKKPGANQAPQALTPEVTPVVDSGPIVVKPKRKTK